MFEKLCVGKQTQYKKLNKSRSMETNMKPQIQSTVYPEIPCSNFNEWINYIRKELEKNFTLNKRAVKRKQKKVTP